MLVEGRGRQVEEEKRKNLARAAGRRHWDVQARWRCFVRAVSHAPHVPGASTLLFQYTPSPDSALPRSFHSLWAAVSRPARLPDGIKNRALASVALSGTALSIASYRLAVPELARVRLPSNE